MHGQLRRNRVIATYGPGALIDLRKHSAIVGGLDTSPKAGDLEEITEVRVLRKLDTMTRATAPRLYASPPDAYDPREPARGIGAWRFPEWFVVQEFGTEGHERSRRFVARKALDEKGRLDGRPVVATRFVRACPKGMWTIWTGGVSFKDRATTAGDSCGSMNVAPTGTSPTSSPLRVRESRGGCTRPPSSSRPRSGPVAARAPGSAATRMRTAISQVAC